MSSYEASTQRARWTIPASEAVWKSDQERLLFIEHLRFMLESVSEFGLSVGLRRAFVTAAHYFHRYFAVHSIEDHPNPRLVALACLYTASKVEELPWRKFSHGSLQYRGFEARRICSAMPEIDMDSLLNCELELLQTLEFSLVVHQTVPRPETDSEDERRETLLLMTTRACLCMSPSEMGDALKDIDLSAYDSIVGVQDGEDE